MRWSFLILYFFSEAVLAQIVAGSIEGYSYCFNVDQMYSQCPDFYNQNSIGSVDDISYSIDNGSTQYLRNGPSYWEGAQQVCGQIYAVVHQALDLDGYSLVGEIEGHSFSFFAPRAQGVRRQCKKFYRDSGLSDVDDIYVSINGAARQHLRNGPSYWSSEDSVCGQIMKLLVEAPGSTAIVVTGSIESHAFNFVAEGIGGISRQCQRFYRNNGIGDVDDIYYSVGNGSQQHLRNGPSYWNGASNVCGQLIQAVAQESDIDVHLVSGSIENHAFQFFGRRPRQIKRQCLDFHAENSIGDVDDIYLTINGGSQQHLRNGPSYWSTAEDVCEQIATYIRNNN